ncbi:MAG: DUF6262 family protein [Brevibacterium aurantiacum]|uniref:DUF6262 family protein n=1 Tax=Brevibacterium aurantiacum TaxID=273384 RepID=UPI003F9075A8
MENGQARPFMTICASSSTLMGGRGMSTHDRINTVERVCTDLVRHGHPVTFTAVAKATGLSRSTLYRDTDLRAIVEHHKHAKTTETPMTVITEEITTLRAAVNTLAEQIRSHEEQLRRLRD